MNAAIWAVVKVAASREISVIGVERGYDGLVDGAFRHLTRAVVSSGNLVPAPGIDGMAGSGWHIARHHPLSAFLRGVWPTGGVSPVDRSGY